MALAGNESAGAAIGGGAFLLAGLLLAPELELPALAGLSLVGAGAGAGVGYAVSAIENSPETLLFTALAIGLAVYAAKKL